MATFQTIVMITAAIILLVSLCFIGLALRNAKNNAIFPPVIANCPDYWTDTSGNNGSRCINEQNIGSMECIRAPDFTTAMYAGTEGSCEKLKWATTCNLSWDGITNNADVCGSS